MASISDTTRQQVFATADHRCEYCRTSIIGLTPTGRTTVVALRLNNDYVIEARALWIARDWHPPEE